MRAAGWNDAAVALVLAWLPRRLPDSAFAITAQRVEMQLWGEVRLVIHSCAGPS